MNRFARILALSAALALVVGAANTVSGKADKEDDKEVKAAQKDIVDLAKGITDGKVDAKKAAAIHKKYEDLNTVMTIYKPRDKGGLGYGSKGKGDGIELRLIAWGKKAPSKMQLQKEQDDLLKLAKINIAMAEVTKLYAPTKSKGGKGAKEWNQYAEEMKKGTMELIEATRKADPDAFRKAANNINAGCQNCHTDFRDNN